MKSIILNMSATVKNTVFAVLYLIPLVAAVFPPLYLVASGRSGLFLGAPFTVWYWLFDGLFLGLVIWALYCVEELRGEVEFDNIDSLDGPEGTF